MTMKHKSTILPPFFPGSCFSRLSAKILFNLEAQIRFLVTGRKKDSCLKFKMERILTDRSGKKEPEKNYKIFGISWTPDKVLYDRKKKGFLFEVQDEKNLD
jgi:hypothetical protein